MSRPSRKQRLRETRPDRFAELIRVATEMLATEGFSSASISRIGEGAEVGIGTIYSYFDDKEDLFLTCVEEAAATDLKLKKSGIDTSRPALEMLKSIIRVDHELAEIDPQGQRLLRSVFYGINSHLSVGHEAQRSYFGSIDLVQQALAKGEAEGVFALGERLPVAAMAVTAVMEGFHVLGHLLGGDSPAGTAELAGQALDLLCRGILSDAGRPKPSGGA